MTPFQYGDLARHHESGELMQVRGSLLVNGVPKVQVVWFCEEDGDWRREFHDAEDLVLVKESRAGVIR